MIKPVTMYSVICDRCGKTYGVWHEVKDKKFKTKPNAEAWARKNLV